MDRESIIDFILDHYESPRHFGAIADPTITRTGVNPGCGDIVTIFLQADGEAISKISFEGEGCTISQAGASVITEMFAGKTLSEIENLPGSAILDLFGRDIAGTRFKCALLGLDTAQKAVRALREGTEAGQESS